MNLNNGIDLALQIKATRAFQKLADMRSKEFAGIEAGLDDLFGQTHRAVDDAAIAQLENLFAQPLDIYL
jgi:hypothetical protein